MGLKGHDFADDGDDIESWTRTLVGFPTYRQDGQTDDSSFLEAVEKALNWIQEWAIQRDIEWFNWENRVLELSVGEGSSRLGLAVHVDVVPPGNETWSVPDPFSVHAEQREGRKRLIGRGVVDDKGPLAVFLVLLDVLKRQEHQLPGVVSLIVDTAEEVGFENIREYYRANPNHQPDRALVADGFFPLVAGEKELLQFDLHLEQTHSAESESGWKIVSFSGGEAYNQVPDQAEARLEGGSREELLTRLEELSPANQNRIEIESEGGIQRIVGRGDTAHASYPEEGVNAFQPLFELFGALDLGDSSQVRLARWLSSLLDRGEYRYDGQWLGLAGEDDRFQNASTLNLGMAQYRGEKGELTLSLDARLVPGESLADTIESLRERVTALAPDAWTADLEIISSEESLEVDTQTPLASAVLGAYRSFTGFTDAQPVYIGGRTHATAIPNSFTCGVMVPDRFSEYGFHGVDEQIDLEELVRAARIYYRALRTGFGTETA